MTASGERDGCVFCAARDSDDEAASLVVHRGTSGFVLLNLYPYNNGHLMVVPNRHIPDLTSATPAELAELMELARLSEMVLTEICQPHGLNMGINLGRPAGAGILDHIHLHVVPRWAGDTSFMSVVGDVRVLPEELPQTAAKMRPVFARLSRQERQAHV